MEVSCGLFDDSLVVVVPPSSTPQQEGAGLAIVQPKLRVFDCFSEKGASKPPVWQFTCLPLNLCPLAIASPPPRPLMLRLQQYPDGNPPARRVPSLATPPNKNSFMYLSRFVQTHGAAPRDARCLAYRMSRLHRWPGCFWVQICRTTPGAALRACSISF